MRDAKVVLLVSAVTATPTGLEGQRTKGRRMRCDHRRTDILATRRNYSRATMNINRVAKLERQHRHAGKERKREALSIALSTRRMRNYWQLRSFVNRYLRLYHTRACEHVNFGRAELLSRKLRIRHEAAALRKVPRVYRAIFRATTRNERRDAARRTRGFRVALGRVVLASGIGCLHSTHCQFAAARLVCLKSIVPVHVHTRRACRIHFRVYECCRRHSRSLTMR